MALLRNFKHDPMADSELPYRVKTSFEQVFAYWEEKAANANQEEASFARDILERTKHAEVLRKPFEDWKILEKYEEEISLLLSVMFPEPLVKNEIKAASMPFKPLFFNPTERFEQIISNAGEDFHLTMRDYDPDFMYLSACVFLLNAKYHANLDFKKPMYFDIPDANGTLRHYRAFYNADFSVFKTTEKTPEITPETIRLLVDNFDDIALWKEKIPPDSFNFEGFGLVTLFDVTADEALSALKYQLLESNALHSPESIKKLEMHLRSWFNTPGINLGIAAFDNSAHRVSNVGHGTWNSILLDDRDECQTEQCFCEGSFQHIFKEAKNFIVSDVLKHKNAPSQLIQKLVKKGINSVIVAPLMFNDQVIGFLELTSETVCELNSVLANKLGEITALFAIALKRNIDEYSTKLEAIVQEQFTAIHPSVSWRFFKSAEHILKSRVAGKAIEPEPIVFSDVLPIYGQFDIRGSSSARNKAIQHDLVQQLTLAERVLNKAIRQHHLPVYNQLIFRINGFRSELQNGINAGDEVTILQFLNTEIYPVFNHLETLGSAMKNAVKTYLDALDPQLKVVYKERKAYEATVTLINDRISEYLEKQQELAQAMFPHYFEKYNTDGVEYNIYIGQSLLQNRTYHPIYLQNLRLWQLLMTCGVVNLIESVKPEMSNTLDIASLILIHNTPLSVRFRMDEKQFDVDGAYNVRYEIVKKRIDKANIMGTRERLTQPGKIAIVYSQENEATEYRKYLEYLQSIHAVGPDIEDVQLEDLQGTAGLRALRADVMPNTDSVKEALRDLQLVESR